MRFTVLCLSLCVSLIGASTFHISYNNNHNYGYCGDPDNSHTEERTYRGPDTAFDTDFAVVGRPWPVPNSSANTWVTYAGTMPTEIGVEWVVTPSALPTDTPAPPTLAWSFVIPAPEIAHNDKILPSGWKSVQVNWYPNGHPPAGVYDVPQWDIHFNSYTLADIQAITPLLDGCRTGCKCEFVSCDIEARCEVAPAFLPQGYQRGTPCIPFMGVHWDNFEAPEFRPDQSFRSSLRYGSDQGRYVFWEPQVASTEFDRLDGDMIDYACASIRRPSSYGAAGWYPRQYCFSHDGDRFRVWLADFVWMD